MNQLTSHALPAEETLSEYERDLVAWLEKQASILRAGKFETLDLHNLVEELEAMAGRDRRELASRLAVLLTHLLKCQFQPDQKSSSWIDTIREQRDEIAALLEQSPSLRQLVHEYSQDAYQRAVKRAVDQTGLASSAFPTRNPFTAEQILDETFLP
ncbi:MAG: DUF29 domain-containing protein [Bdellovibrionales bacterium]|nr:DUF29 domain-containing protein [Massilia sp.]